MAEGEEGMMPATATVRQLLMNGYDMCPKWYRYLCRYRFLEEALIALPADDKQEKPCALDAREWCREVLGMRNIRVEPRRFDLAEITAIEARVRAAVA